MVVFAQQTLAGVDQDVILGESWMVTLLIRPRGRWIAQSQLSVIHVNAEVHIALRGLATGGTCELAVSYRPDTDMPIFHTSVRFTAGPRRAPIRIIPCRRHCPGRVGRSGLLCRVSAAVPPGRACRLGARLSA